MKKKIIAFLLLFLCLQGCRDNDIYPDIGFDIPSSIFIEDRIYWESEVVNEIDEIVQVGNVKNVAKKNHLPDRSYMINASGGVFLEKPIYKSRDDYYILFDNVYHKFVYNAHMDLGETILNTVQNKEEAIPTPDGVKPNFVYNGMRYFFYRDLADFKFPNSFQKVGKITKKTKWAAQNFEGTDIGDVLYADESQNRYMLVKSESANKFFIYENESYLIND